MHITPPEDWPLPPRDDASYLHYLVGDDSVQWFAKLVRVDLQTPATAASESGVAVTAMDSIDVPNALSGAFLLNVYAREYSATRVLVEGQVWRGWSLSEAEYRRIARLVELHPAVEEFKRLAAYSV